MIVDWHLFYMILEAKIILKYKIFNHSSILECCGSLGSLFHTVGLAGRIVILGNDNVFQRRTPPLAGLSFPLKGVETGKWMSCPLS